MPTLTFLKEFASLKSFSPVSIPTFTLLTGLNGSGKTHLLKAIQDGSVRVDNWNKDDVRYVDLPRFQSRGEEVYRGSREYEEARNRFLRDCSTHFSTHQSDVILNAKANYLYDPAERFDRDPRSNDRQGWLELSNDSTVDPDIRRAIKDAVQGHEREWRERVARDYPAVYHRIQEDPLLRSMDITLFDRSVMHDLSQNLLWGTGDLLSHNFSSLFGIYRDRELENNLRLLRRSEDALEPPVFREKFGEPPWTFLNDLLAEMGFDLKVLPPDPYQFSEYSLTLATRSDGKQIPVENLSSGEKVLLAFVSCLYQVDDKRQHIPLPKVLLLDEVDATLHPSMARDVVNIIETVLVKELGITVIAATHSPSTVALAPDASVYVMEKAVPGLRQETKGRALNLLTAGVPILSIDYSGQRQVFVESPRDAIIYQRVYTVVKSALNADRTLAFIATGKESKGGDKDTGSKRVCELVKTLSENGNRSIFGIIDWDKKNNPSPRIKVLAHARRYALENCLLDPLLLGAYLASNRQQIAEQLGLPQSMTGFSRLPPERLQEAVITIEEAVLGANSGAQRQDCEYAPGLQLTVRCDYLEMDAHELGSKVVQRVTKLTANALMCEIARRVINEVPEFIPMELREVLSSILNEPIG